MLTRFPLLHSSRLSVLVESKESGQTLRPVVTVPVTLESGLYGGYKVKYQVGTKQITLYRNLLAAVLYEHGGVSIEEILVLYDLTKNLEEKAQKDRAFEEKYGRWLITTFEFIQGLNPREFPFHFRGNIEESEKILKPYLPSRQAYHGWRRNPVRVTPASVILRNPLIPPKRNPIKRYVGVGYQDKGSRRDTANDGTPRWQEVAGRIDDNGKLIPKTASHLDRKISEILEKES